ncbi:hypothetical protein IGI04_029579 [Brassica rapa subsp. trilocularis]|uniref:Uncharacterized protein n=1 Tax=Brassica rapa subsp. trilocularis TaxID=1813537 RepID=A0ABQ7LN92_BRACM|nr:hypothetical protein IGI04_029579 [Brassica rapa subsp. trilocularis]
MSSSMPLLTTAFHSSHECSSNGSPITSRVKLLRSALGKDWSPVFAAPEIQKALQRAAVDSNSQGGSIFQLCLVTGSWNLSAATWMFDSTEGMDNCKRTRK